MRSGIRRGTQQRTCGMQRIRRSTFPARKVRLPRLDRKFDRCTNYAIIVFTLSRSIRNRRSTAIAVSQTQKHRTKAAPLIGMNACRHIKQCRRLVEMNYHGRRINTGTRKSEQETRTLSTLVSKRRFFVDEGSGPLKVTSTLKRSNGCVALIS